MIEKFEHVQTFFFVYLQSIWNNVDVYGLFNYIEDAFIYGQNESSYAY